jgi:hypothetical protein
MLNKKEKMNNSDADGLDITQHHHRQVQCWGTPRSIAYKTLYAEALRKS